MSQAGERDARGTKRLYLTMLNEQQTQTGVCRKVSLTGCHLSSFPEFVVGPPTPRSLAHTVEIKGPLAHQSLR